MSEAKPILFVDDGADLLDVNEVQANRSQAITELVFEMLGASESFLDDSTLPGEPVQTAEDAAAEPWVLCVEDDRDFSLALQLRFKRHGISVVRAFEGVEGIQTALTRPAEAIILDYNLPNGRGDYVLRQLKTNPLTKAIPVIVVSGQKRSGLEKEMHCPDIHGHNEPPRRQSPLFGPSGHHHQIA